MALEASCLFSQDVSRGAARPAAKENVVWVRGGTWNAWEAAKRKMEILEIPTANANRLPLGQR